MREIIVKTLELARAIADWTPSTVDDKIILALESILNNEALLNFLVDLIDQWLSGPEPVMALDSTNARLGADFTEAAEEAGIDIATILMIARIIMEIIEKWRNR